MKSRREPGPGSDGRDEDGEELSSSPSSSPGAGKAPVRPTEAEGFADGGTADLMAPGPELAGLVTAVTGPGGTVLGTLADEEVLGVLGAVARLAAWVAWLELAVLTEFLRRRPAALAGSAAARVAAEEAAWKTGESWSRVLDQATHAAAVTARLPHTMQAMEHGLLSGYKVKIIEAQTTDLTAEDAAEADVTLAAAGQVKNPAGLRDFARRQAARLDPEATARKKERCRRDAYVRAWAEDSGNMGLSARQMPAADGIIAFQNIERRALDLHAAGIEGTAGQLQVQAMTDFLLGRATPGAYLSTYTDRGAYEGTHPDEDEDGGEDGSAYRKNSRVNGRGGGRGGWAVNPILIVPWDPATGRPSGTAELPGYGPLDEHDTTDLLEEAGQHPDSRWCLTMTGLDGTAAAHACIHGRRTIDDIIAAGQASTGAAGLAAALRTRLEPVARGACEHTHAEDQYRPSRKLRHLVMARSARCAAPGCDRPASACDQDHTIAWEEDGITCSCNLAPLCRHHHQIKQAQGWKLEQQEPGVLRWTTPAGLTRTTIPTNYQD
jgi:hypothetical protein